MKTTELPCRMTYNSAGLDFHAPQDIELNPGEWTMVDSQVKFTGFETPYFEFYDGNEHYNRQIKPNSWFMMLVPRSGLGTKYGVRFRNTIGIVDMDYRDTIKFTMTADVPITIKEGARFAQGIYIPFIRGSQDNIRKEERNGGIGSTDKENDVIVRDDWVPAEKDKYNVTTARWNQ